MVVLPLIQGCSLVTSLTADNKPTDRHAIVPPDAANSRVVPRAEKPRANSVAVNTGVASWYGPGFIGKKTASGEVFDGTRYTAAHQTLPLGSKAKVTNLSNGKSVEVVINDRGPYTGDRIIDLSPAAARAIEMIDHGVIQVRIDLLGDQRKTPTVDGADHRQK